MFRENLRQSRSNSSSVFLFLCPKFPFRNNEMFDIDYKSNERKILQCRFQVVLPQGVPVSSNQGVGNTTVSSNRGRRGAPLFHSMENWDFQSFIKWVPLFDPTGNQRGTCASLNLGYGYPVSFKSLVPSICGN